jgi:hypothetical protein
MSYYTYYYCIITYKVIEQLTHIDSTDWLSNRSSVLAFLKYYLSLNSDNSEAVYDRIFTLVLVCLRFFASSIQRYYTNFENLRLTLLDYSYDPIQPRFKILSKVIRSGSKTCFPNYWLYCRN